MNLKNKELSINKGFLAILITVCIWFFILFMINYSNAVLNDAFYHAVTADLILTVPLLYFLIIRKTKIPKLTTVPILFISLAVGSYLIPVENQIYLSLFKIWFLPVIEIIIIGFITFKIRAAYSAFRSLKEKQPDFFSTLKDVCSDMLPSPLVLPFATEIAVIYYGFINWKSQRLNDNEFTYHKRSGSPALFGILVLIIGAETVGIHFLIATWSTTAAWILSGISIYTAIQCLGFAKSLSQRPISINQNSVTLKYGIISEVDIPFTEIESIELSRKALKKDKLARKISLLGEIESHNMIIHTKNEQTLSGLYGVNRKFKSLALHVDEPRDFIDALNIAGKLNG